jgi:hypothetical protein
MDMTGIFGQWTEATAIAPETSQVPLISVMRRPFTYLLVGI